MTVRWHSRRFSNTFNRTTANDRRRMWFAASTFRCLNSNTFMMHNENHAPFDVCVSNRYRQALRWNSDASSLLCYWRNKNSVQWVFLVVMLLLMPLFCAMCYTSRSFTLLFFNFCFCFSVVCIPTCCHPCNRCAEYKQIEIVLLFSLASESLLLSLFRWYYLNIWFTKFLCNQCRMETFLNFLRTCVVCLEISTRRNLLSSSFY